MTIATDLVQVGLDIGSPATNNFTFRAPVDGTFRLSVGNAGTTTDVLKFIPSNLSGTGLLKNTAGTLSIAVSGTDYAPITSGTSILKGNGSGGFSAAVSSTDYAPVTSGTSILKGNGSGGFSAATTNTDYLAQFYKSAGAIVVDKGSISAATVTFDYSAGSVQTYTATGSTVTWAVSNWPTSGNEGYLLIRATNQGAYTLAATLVTNWIKPDGTTTGTMSVYLAANTGRTALQTSGVDQILLWTRDAGTTVYGKLV